MVIGNDVVPLTENDVVTLALVLAAPDELVLVGLMLDVTLGGSEMVVDWAWIVAQRVRINTKRAAIIVAVGVELVVRKVTMTHKKEAYLGQVPPTIAIWTGRRWPAPSSAH